MKIEQGTVAVVTGAASGIGRAVSGALAERGARVALADVEEPALQAAVDELSAAGHDVIGVPTDVAREADVQALRDRVLERYGRVDLVHNNAGVVAAGAVEDISIETWRWVVGVDLWGVLYGIRAFLPLMKVQGSGHIVSTASSCGLQSSQGIAPYNVAKFGVVALSETVRIECEGTGVGVSVLCPGAINTRIVEAERNRPAHVPASTGPEAERFSTFAGELLRTKGLPPSEVAALVLDAVETDRFWILTHPGWYGVVAERAAGMPSGALVRDFGG